MKNYRLSVPKPCHENWNEMTPNEKGKFCSSCTKTVVDFTQKTPLEIQEYLIENKGKRVCGHFYRKQLDSIVIQLPETTFYQPLCFQKLFVLSLLFAMGTTLCSCKTDTGKTQKIEKVEFIDVITKTEIAIDSLKIDKDTVVQKEKCKIPPPPTPITGITIIETIGIVKEEDKGLKPIDSIPEVEIMGDIIEGEVEIIDNPVYFINLVDKYPRFKEDEHLPETEAKQIFEQRMNDFITENFDFETTMNLGLTSGKHKIYTQFSIDTEGNVFDIKVRAPHITLKEYTEKLVKKLPQFIPAKNDGKDVITKYTLPITFKVD